ncbi:hypothetical protein D3C73_1189360 [compost metagenome]
MNIVIREPITLECGQLFMRHIQWRLHTLNVDYGRHGIAAMVINAQVLTCDADTCDEVLDMVARHASSTVSLVRESSGYYAMKIQSE